jgi:hypothetical protein
MTRMSKKRTLLFKFTDATQAEAFAEQTFNCGHCRVRIYFNAAQQPYIAVDHTRKDCVRCDVSEAKALSQGGQLLWEA